jgi:outer membrane protein
MELGHPSGGKPKGEQSAFFSTSGISLELEMTRVNSRLGSSTGTLIYLLALLFIGACSAAPVLAQMPETAPATYRVLTLDEAIKAAEANNRAIRVAQLDREKALDQVQVARTHRLPEFSLIALGSQSLSRLGLTLDEGSLGNYTNIGPIPGKTTTLESPLRVGGIFFASVAQPLSQQHKIGLNIQLAQVGVEAADERIRSKRQSTVNEARRLYYGILQAESGKKSLQATVDFLRRLDRDTDQNLVQQVALKADSLNVKAQLVQAEYELLKLDNPLQTQKQQLNRLMGREPDTPFDVDPASTVDFELPQLRDACARAIESRPEVRLARLQVRKAELDRRIKNAERIPDVSFTVATLATANLANALPRNVSLVGIQVNWDVFDWGRKRKELSEKRQAEEQARVELKDAEALVIVDVSHQYRRLIEVRKELEVAKLLQSAARELLRVTKNQYTQHYALLSDVLKVQSSLAEADHRFTQALLNLTTAQADFKKAMGEDQ